MRKERIFLILGIWMVILPFLGFPSSWKDVLFSLSGLVIVYFSYTMYLEAKTKELKDAGGLAPDNFSENF